MSIRPRTENRAGHSPPWNGWPLCARTSRIKANRWCVTTAVTAMYRGENDSIPCILEPEGDVKIFRRNWARLIQKIDEVDPLVCPKCQGAMRVISSIEDPLVIRAILEHLGIWLVRSRPPPKIHAPPVCTYDTGLHSTPYIKGEHSQLPVSDDYLYRDPEYTWDQYIQSQ